jgi:hypothetical protein
VGGGDLLKCGWCDEIAEYFCDHPITSGEGSPSDAICDRPVCPTHATEVGSRYVVCPDHAPPGGA